MKTLFYSFVIVSVVLLALFTISQLSTAQNKSEANTESENQKGLQKTNRTQTRSSDNIWTQISTNDDVPTTAIDLGTLGGFYSVAYAVNDNGMVVGESTLPGNQISRAFVWTPTIGMIDLGSLGGNSLADLVNENGMVAGRSFPTGNIEHGFVWTQTGGMVDLGTLGGSSSTPVAINNNGMVVGSSHTLGNSYNAFAWTQAGGMVSLGTLGGTFSQASAVNDNGVVVGMSSLPGDTIRHAFIWTQTGGMVDLNTLGDDFPDQARAINNNGMILGTSSVWTQAGGTVDLGTLGGTFSTARAINDNGMVVGDSRLPGNNGERAFAWTQAGGMVDLGSLGEHSVAYDINDNGMVVGASWSTMPMASFYHATVWLALVTSTTALPQCSNPAPSWNFGDVPFGTAQEKTFTVTNILSIAFTPQNYTLEGAADYGIINNSCENSLLAPSQSCSWTARFTARAGGRRDNQQFNLLTAPGQPNGSDCTNLTGNGTINSSYVDARHQFTEPWGSLPYAHCPASPPPPALSYTIRARGCTLTALTMAINYVKKAAPISPPIQLETPGTLQAFGLSPGINGFSRGLPADVCTRNKPGNDVLFGNIVSNYAIPFSQTRPFKWNPVSIKSLSNPNAATRLTESLANGYPVIVAIVHKKNRPSCNVQNPADICYSVGHFVLVTKDLGGGNFQVVDPGNSSATTLQSVLNYRVAAGWETRGYVSVKNNAYSLPTQSRNCSVTGLCGENARENLVLSDISTNDGSITVVADENVDFLIVNAEGQRTGYDDATERVVEEIPNSSYGLENIFTMDDPEPTNAVSSASINQPKNGVYEIKVKGAQQGQYSVSVDRTNRYGQSLSQIVFSGAIQADETKTHTFTYSFSNSLFTYDADAIADLSVRRPSDDNWYILRGTAGYMVMTFGVAGDVMVPADYDGDGRTDVAVFRPSTGQWFIFNSQSQSFTTTGWGANGDLPVPADHDGDGRADLVVFRPSTNTWYTRFSLNNNFSTVGFGVAGDKPVVGDFDGDGKADIGLYRPSDGNWYILKTGFGFFVQTWGVAGDIPVPADYDGDGKTDVAVFRPSTGQWFRIQSTAGFDTVNWGVNGDKPIPADYDGDGKSDVAVFRSSNATWYIVGSTAGQLIQNYGVAGDLPTQGAFIY